MNEPQLRRGFGMPMATFVVIASMVGTGILVSPGYGIQALESYPLLFGLWVVGGALALCGALCVAELAAAMPRAGGEYVYLREAYGPLPAFLSGWASFFVGFSAPLAINAHLSATYLLTPFPLEADGAGVWLRPIIGACIIAAMTVPNLLGHRQSTTLQALTTLAKLLLLSGLVLAGFAGGEGRIANLVEGKTLSSVPLGDAATQLFFIMIAYSGWNAASYLAGEIREPGRTLPRALLGGCGLVVVLYLALNLVFAYALPVKEARAVEDVEKYAQVLVEHLFGSRAANVFAFAIGLTLLASISAWIVTGPRIYFAMAQDGLFPAFAGVVDANTGVPSRAMILQSACAIAILLFAGTFEDLYMYTAVGLSLFSTLFIAAVFVLRWRQPEMPRPFRTPGYPVVPAVYLMVTLGMAWFAFQLWPKPSVVSLASILAGVPFFFVWKWFFRPQTAESASVQRDGEADRSSPPGQGPEP